MPSHHFPMACSGCHCCLESKTHKQVSRSTASIDTVPELHFALSNNWSCSSTSLIIWLTVLSNSLRVKGQSLPPHICQRLRSVLLCKKLVKEHWRIESTIGILKMEHVYLECVHWGRLWNELGCIREAHLRDRLCPQFPSKAMAGFQDHLSDHFEREPDWEVQMSTMESESVNVPGISASFKSMFLPLMVLKLAPELYCRQPLQERLVFGVRSFLTQYGYLTIPSCDYPSHIYLLLFTHSSLPVSKPLPCH